MSRRAKPVSSPKSAPRMRKLWILPTALATSLALSGCALFQGTPTPTPVPLTEDGALKAFKPFTDYAAAPCNVQKQAAAHNSVYDTLKNKRETVYKAPCEVAEKKTVVAPEKKAVPTS